MTIPMLSISDAVSHNAVRRPNHPALINKDGYVVTYSKFDNLMNKTTNYLKKIGCEDGEIFGISMQDNIEQVVLILAVIRMGGIVLPMDVRWTSHEKIRVAQFFGAKAIITEDLLEKFNCILIDKEWHLEVNKQNSFGDYPSNLDRKLWLSLSSGTTKSLVSFCITSSSFGSSAIPNTSFNLSSILLI